MVVKLWQLQSLKQMQRVATDANKADVGNVIKLYKDRTIGKFATALKLATQLSSGKNSQLAGKKGLARQYGKEPETGKLKPTQSFFIKGVVKTQSKYTKTTNKGTHQYPKVYHDNFVVAKTITAKTEAFAIQMFRKMVTAEFEMEGYSKSTKVNEVVIKRIEATSAYKARAEADTPMKAASYANYHFIPSDDRHLQNDGFCVVDHFVGIYGPKIKKLTRDYFIGLCAEFHGTKTVANQMDADLEDDDDVAAAPQWEIAQGITPKCLCWVCERLNISCYSFDITNQCFMKYITPFRNYDALVYYCVNGHMYWVADKKAALCLTRKAREVEKKIKTVVLADEFEKQNPFKNKVILENVQIAELAEHKDVVIIYNQPDLNEELDEIIILYNYIPKVKNKLFAIVGIHFDFEGRNVYLATDPNDTRLISHVGIKLLCEKHEVTFSNQSFGGLIKELRSSFFADKSSRHIFSKQERLTMHADCGGKCALCSHEIEVKHMQVDHIQPLAEGGTNGFDNLQILCKQCHFQKTRGEQENGYVKISDTASSFNIKTTEIFNSPICATHAFVESLMDEPPSGLKKNKIHHIDINGSRKNCLLYSQHEYPLFTVMDQPAVYREGMGYKRPGIYYVETRQYMPMRGNGWYSHAMIQYCMQQGLIEEHMIKNVMLSSLTVARDHFNDFIEFLYSSVDEHGKLAPNTMIGSLKPKARDNWKTLCITTDPDVAMYHFLKKDGCYIDSRDIGETAYHQVYERFETERQETEAPIYNMILEQEAIELHRLCTLIEANQGILLDLSTDCVSCVFPTNDMPFELNGINLTGYYYDDERKFPKYKIEHKDYRLRCSRLPQHLRASKYTHVEPQWTVMEDMPDNDFGPLVRQVLDRNLAVNILGRGGTGKTFLIDALQSEMCARGLNYESLAPTNVACRLIKGKTIHKFAISQTITSLRKLKLDYIFVDEISLVPEIFYKYFLVLERALPKMRFIISGDYYQLLPVKDRVGECDYQNSNALHELCHGNRLQLTTCRRADRTLFDLVAPSNIWRLKYDDFGHNYTDVHLSYTNNKRKEINHFMMNKVARQKRYAKPLELAALDYDSNSQDVRLIAGCPIIARINCKDLGIWNNECFTIAQIQPKTGLMIISDGEFKKLEIKFGDFQRLFRPAYCVTIHCAQGKTINRPYSIHEWAKLDGRLKYVALSRSTSRENINLC